MEEHITIKRVYDPPSDADGRRVLVDRLWPRGVSKETAEVDVWMRELAPSDELRRWYGHDPERWSEFADRYREELASPTAQGLMDELLEQAREHRLTLLCAARDANHSNAAVLAAVLKEWAR